MTTYELISTISLCFTALITVSTVIVPLIINTVNNRRKEKQEKIEHIFKEQFEIINNLNIAYGNWKVTKNKQPFLEEIYKTMANVDQLVRANLTKLADALDNEKNIENQFKICMNSIFNFLGIEESWTESRELTSIKLKRNLYKKYRKIKHT